MQIIVSRHDSLIPLMAAALSDAALVPIYGVECTRAIQAYFNDFCIHQDGFLPFVARVIQGRPDQSLLVVDFPLALPYLGLPPGSKSSPVLFCVLFKTQFPR